MGIWYHNEPHPQTQHSTFEALYDHIINGPLARARSHHNGAFACFCQMRPRLPIFQPIQHQRVGNPGCLVSVKPSPKQEKHRYRTKDLGSHLNWQKELWRSVKWSTLCTVPELDSTVQPKAGIGDSQLHLLTHLRIYVNCHLDTRTLNWLCRTFRHNPHWNCKSAVLSSLLWKNILKRCICLIQSFVTVELRNSNMAWSASPTSKRLTGKRPRKALHLQGPSAGEGPKVPE